MCVCVHVLVCMCCTLSPVWACVRTCVRACACNLSVIISWQLENFRIMFHMMTQDHELPDLIWNQQTRRELRHALEQEIKSFDVAVRDAGDGGSPGTINSSV